MRFYLDVSDASETYQPSRKCNRHYAQGMNCYENKSNITLPVFIAKNVEEIFMLGNVSRELDCETTCPGHVPPTLLN